MQELFNLSSVDLQNGRHIPGAISVICLNRKRMGNTGFELHNCFSDIAEIYRFNRQITEIAGIQNPVSPRLINRIPIEAYPPSA